MKTVTFFLFIGLLAVVFAQSRGRQMNSQGYDYYVNDYDEFDYDVDYNYRQTSYTSEPNTYIPIGSRSCQCTNYYMGSCSTIRCCQSYRTPIINYPTYNKPIKK